MTTAGISAAFVVSLAAADSSDLADRKFPNLVTTVGAGAYSFVYNADPAGGPRLACAFGIGEHWVLTGDVTYAWTSTSDDGWLLGGNVVFRKPWGQHGQHSFLAGVGYSYWFQNDNLHVPRGILGYGFFGDRINLRVVWEPSLPWYKSCVKIVKGAGGAHGGLCEREYVVTMLAGFSLFLGFPVQW